jgi:hypothetical protein
MQEVTLQLHQTSARGMSLGLTAVLMFWLEAHVY